MRPALWRGPRILLELHRCGRALLPLATVLYSMNGTGRIRNAPGGQDTGLGSSQRDDSLPLALVSPEPPEGEPESPLLPSRLPVQSPVLAFLPLRIAWGSGPSPESRVPSPLLRTLHCQLLPPRSSPQPPHLNGKVDEAADAEGVLHEVEDELHVLHQRQVIRHAEGEARDLLQNVPGHLPRAAGVSREWRGGGRRARHREA